MSTGHFSTGGERDDLDVPPAGRYGGIAALRGGGHTGVGRLGLCVVADRLLVPTGTHRFDTGDDEVIVLPCGAVAVETDGSCLQLSGRENVFAGPTDLAYIGVGQTVTLRSRRWRPVRALVLVEQGAAGALRARRRGSCGATRRRPVQPPGAQLRHPGALEASKIIACEVITLQAIGRPIRPQARRGDGHRVGAGGDLLLRDRRRSAC